MAPTCDSKSCRILKLWINKRQRTSGERVNTKPNRKKRCHIFKNVPNPFPFDLNIKTLTNLSSYKTCLMLLILIKTVNVTVASIDIDDNNSSKNQTNLNLFKLVEDNKISLDKSSLNDGSHYFKVINLISDLETKAAHHNVGNLNNNNKNINKKFNKKVNDPPHVQKSLEDNTKAINQEKDLRSQKLFGNVFLIRNLENETIFFDIHKRTRRKKRYVKFPPGEGFRFSGRGQGRPFHPVSSVSGNHHGGIPPWASGRPNGFFHSNVPTMRPRSPRLVFRDPVEPGTLTAPGSFFGNGLQDIAFDDEREERGAKGKYPSMGDQSLCTNGKCEFFLTCWMSSGLIDGSCGGFLYACCQRPDKEAPKTNEHHTNDVITLPTNFGPVVNDFRCGVSIGKLGAQRRIVGGDEAGFGSFPWQAYIRIGSSRCGGSLVNRFHVVTAGHCVARASARQVQVTLGDYVINSAVEPLPAYTFGVREIRVHPYFKFTPQADRFDVAVLKLDRPVQYMPHIAPICLPEKNEDFLGQYGWAAGWGALQAGSRLRPKTLQAVDVPVIDNRLCERWHKSNGINVVIYDEMMCAGYRNGGKDSCQGDSGGPLMMEKSNRWYLIGIVSAGYSCAQRGQPGIYHRVAHTVDWISYIINS